LTDNVDLHSVKVKKHIKYLHQSDLAQTLVSEHTETHTPHQLLHRDH